MSTLFIRYLFTNLCYIYICFRVINIKPPRVYILYSLIISALTTCTLTSNPTLRILITLFCNYLFLAVTTKIKPSTSLSISLISLGLSYVFLSLSGIVVGIAFTFIYKTATNVPYALTFLPTGILQTLFTFLFLKIQRFKSGLRLTVTNKFASKGVSISLLFILLFAYTSSNTNTIFYKQIFVVISLIFLSILILFYWRHRITQTYREKLRLANEKSLEDEISNQKETISNLKADNDRLSQIVHKDNKIILAMLTAVNEHLENTSNLAPKELAIRGKELSIQLQDMAKDRQRTLSVQTKQPNALPKSGLHTVDGMLSFMETRAKESNITYKLQIEGNTKEIAGNAIQEADLLHLLGDLIDNAIIATKHTNDKKEILIHLGSLQNHFLLEISDSGIPFSLNTYQSFGNEPHTTHVDDGGSGIGLMDIWKLKKKYKASLHIYEYEEGESIFTKKLTFIFDRKNHFLLQTPRHKEASHTVIRGDLYIFPNKSNASMN